MEASTEDPRGEFLTVEGAEVAPLEAPRIINVGLGQGKRVGQWRRAWRDKVPLTPALYPPPAWQLRPFLSSCTLNFLLCFPLSCKTCAPTDCVAQAIDACTAHTLRRRLPLQIIPALAAFHPDLIFISAGFDAHLKDEINFGYLGISEPDYAWITDQICQACNLSASSRPPCSAPYQLVSAPPWHPQPLRIAEL